MSLIPTEVLLARQKREEAARIAGDESLRGLIVRANADNENLLRSIRSQTKLVREIRDEFTATLGDVTARTLYNETVRISDTAAIIERQDLFDVSLGEVRNGVSAVQASVEEYRVVAANATTAFAQVSTKLLSRVNDSVAAITQEATTRADEDSALATLITTLAATVGANTAAITTEATTRATDDSALASLITSLSSSSGVHTFVQSSAPTAIGTGDLWFDSDDNNKLYRWSGSAWVAVDDVRIVTTEGNVTTLSSTVSTLSGTVSTLSTTVSSLSTSVSGLSSTVATNSADITTLQTSDTTQGASIASLTSSVGVAQSTADAKVKTWVQGSAPTASATGDIWVDTSDGHKMKRWSGSAWVDTTVGDGAISAAVTTEQSARIAADGAIHAQWGVAINVNGAVTGRIHLDGTGSTSEFMVDATKFTVYNGTAGVAPFQVVGGQVRVQSLVLVAGDIPTIPSSGVSGLAATATSSDFSAVTGATKPANNADVTLSAINGDLYVTGGGINLAGGRIQSSNFVAGTSGWRVNYDGSAEFQNVIVRGTLNAADLVAGTISTSRLPDTVTASGVAGNFDFGPANITTTSYVSQGSVYLSSLPNLNRLITCVGFLEGDSTTTTTYLEIRRDSTVLLTKSYSVPAFSFVPFTLAVVDTGGAGNFTFYLYGKNGSSSRVISCDGTFLIQQ